MVELDFCLRVLRHGLDYKIGIGDGDGKVELQLDCRCGALDGSEGGIFVEGQIAVGDARAPFARTICHVLNRGDVLLVNMVELGLRAPDAPLAP